MPEATSGVAAASIVIVNYNGADFVASSIETALAQRPPCEVIVVDNASTDDSLRVLRGIPGIRLIESERNGGFGAGANLGAAHASGEYVAFLNSDALCDPEWIATIVPWMRSRDVGFASSVIASGEGVWFAGGRWLPIIGASLTLRRVSRRSAWISGCALVVRRASFESLAGFEESFFLYFEDVDLCLRATRAGYRLGVLDRSLVRHDVDGRSSVALGFRKLEIAYRAKGILVRKHVALRYLPIALAFQSFVSPLGQGVPLRRLPLIWRAFYAGFRDVKRLRT